MSSIQPLRVLAQQLRSQSSHSQPCRRTFSSLPKRLAAHNFTMPAMSPTMTEGNISKWNVKEGDSFSTGDILLEIETDKASMDVEAPDDGVMAKIFATDGAKSVKVGSRIAVIADPGDDVNSIEIPADDSKPISSPADNVKGGEGPSYQTSGVEKDVKGTPQNKRPSRNKPKSSAQGAGQNPKYPLYPSVQTLIHTNDLSDSDVAKISASGPGGRLLKGDVLAYLGQVEENYPSEQSARLEKLGHMDLSNIKLLAKQPSKPTEQAPASTPPSVTSLSLPISLAPLLAIQTRIKDTLGVTIPLSTLLARAVDIANDDLPLTKSKTIDQDALFNSILGLNTLPSTVSRGAYLPQIDALTPLPPRSTSSSRRTAASRKQSDIIDLLTSSTSTSSSIKRQFSSRPPPTADLISPSGGSISTSSAGAMNVFSLTVPAGEEKRARTFLERIKSVVEVEPGRLVL